MQNSKIEWTHHTFNIVWGCLKVSPGCANCYAETLARRYGYNVWGSAKTTERRTMSDNYWKQPFRWNEQARKSGERRRVFCGSMCDVFEDHPTNDRERERLWPLIEATPHLDWLLLTKRPEDITSHIPIKWRFHSGEPHNVWYGASVEDQRRADERIPHLLRVPARVRFLSCEPLLGPVDLSPWMEQEYQAVGDGPNVVGAELVSRLPGIHWVIAGGESGHGARPMHPDWARSLRDQCAAAGVPFFFKQWGEWHPMPAHRVVAPRRGYIKDWTHRAYDMPGGELTGRFKWFTFDPGKPTYQEMVAVGRHAAGRLLDSVEHNAYPE